MSNNDNTDKEEKSKREYKIVMAIVIPIAIIFSVYGLITNPEGTFASYAKYLIIALIFGGVGLAVSLFRKKD